LPLIRMGSGVMFDVLDRTLEIVSIAYLRISQGLLAILVIGVFVQVITRYFFATTLIGSGELANLMIVWIVFLMSAVLYRRRRHIVITVLVDVLPLTLQRAADAVVNLGTIVLSVYIVYQFWNVLPFLRLSTPVFQIPDVAFKSAPLFAMIPMAFQAIVNLAMPRGTARS
jgi:TRAP-type C4-dicarboxylate transport system permease small subunit